MNNFHFPKPYKHEHPPIIDLNEIVEAKTTTGQKAADKIATIMGSWKFLIIQTIILTFWVIINITAYTNHWDPYPFILLNLFLSLQAAYTAPIIMMSQNRQSERDRLEAHNDFDINLKAEEEIRVLMDHLNAQNEALEEMHRILNELKNK